VIASTLLLVGGVTALLLGGDRTVKGASALASNLGVPPIAVGMTVVAFGTSAPELVVNLVAAVRGSSDIAFGNVVGSNIANIGLILGVAALIRPLAVDATVIAREIPMMLLASAAALVMAADRLVSGREPVLDRADGILLLLLFCVFMYYTVVVVLRRRRPDGFVDQAGRECPAPGTRSTALNAVWLLLGLGGLFLGGHLTVEGAVGLARGLGVSELIIGITVVAVGTSLPELITSAIAAYRGQHDLAVGNVVGSNIFNLLFVLGLSTTIRPVPVPRGGMLDLLAMIALAALLLPLAITGRRTISRLEGALLIVVYGAFVAWRLVR
jgi:cation:H+ antiporter